MAVSPSRALVVGEHRANGVPAKFRLALNDRLMHMHVIGATGTGKTKFLEVMIRQDIRNGIGVCVIDPHGDLYADLMKFCIAEGLHEHVIPFNPSETDYVVGFNPFAPSEARIEYRAKQLRAACGRAWGMEDFHETPRLSRWLYNIFYVILEQGLTFLDAMHLASLNKDNHRRKAIVPKIRHPGIREDFQGLLQDQRRLREEMESSYNRIFEFLNNDVVRRIFTQDESLNFKQCMSQGKIILCNLSTRKHCLSDEDRNLLGALILNEIYNGAVTREPHERDPFFLYIDEFGRFVSDDIANGLAETRKFGLGYILAHQDLGQLREESELLYGAVMTNTRTKVVFGGLQDFDRELLCQEIFAPDFNLHLIKDQIESVSFRPVNRQVDQITKTSGSATTRGTARSQSTSETDSISHSEGSSTSHAEGETYTRTQGNSRGGSRSHGTSASESDSTSQGRNWGNSTSFNATSEGVRFGSNTAQNEGNSSSNSHGRSWGRNESQGENWSTSDSVSQGRSRTTTQSTSQSKAVGHSTGRSEGITDSQAETLSESTSVSKAWVTFHEEFTQISSRQFYSLDEHMHRAKSLLARLPQGNAVIKVMGTQALPLVVPKIRELLIEFHEYQGFLRAASEATPFLLPEGQAVKFDVAALYETPPGFQPSQNQHRPNGQPKNRKQRSKNPPRTQNAPPPREPLYQPQAEDNDSDDNTEIPLPEL